MAARKPQSGRSPARAASQDERYELIGRIASGLAHELNGPVGIALGFTELSKELLDNSGDGFLQPASLATLKEYLNLTQSANLRARTLARRISMFARLEPGTTSEFDLAEAMDEAAALTSPAVKVAQIELKRRSGLSGPAFVTGDRAVCITAFARMFLSSPKALAGGGTVLWDAAPGQPATGEHASFILIAEPWGTAPSAAWPLPDPVAEAFRNQEGSIGPAVSRKAETRHGGDPPGGPAWEIPGSLPAAAAPAALAGSGPDAALNLEPKTPAAHARAGRRAAGK